MPLSAEEDDLEAARGGDHKAFDRLMVLYRERIKRLCYRMLRNPADADDAVQETFLRVYQNLAKLPEGDRCSNWMYRIATNVCLTKLGRTKEVISLDAFGELLYHASLIEADPSKVIIERMHFEGMVQAVFEHLSEDCGKVVRLHYEEGLDCNEIADRLGMPAGTVRSHLSRSKPIIEKVVREFNKKE
jgi:RNA polymerase sigma-70 factor (ECF subfamily)